MGTSEGYLARNGKQQQNRTIATEPKGVRAWGVTRNVTLWGHTQAKGEAALSKMNYCVQRVESLCGFCQWNLGLQFHFCLLGHVYIAYLAWSLSSGALAWPISWLMAVWVQISTQPACLPAEKRELRGNKEQFLNPLLSWVQSPNVWMLLSQFHCSQYGLARIPVACGRAEGALSFHQVELRLTLRNWAVLSVSCCSLLLMQISVLTLHQSICTYLKSRKAGSLLLGSETSVSLTRLRAMTLFI